jgi:hypothetical protein
MISDAKSGESGVVDETIEQIDLGNVPIAVVKPGRANRKKQIGRVPDGSQRDHNKLRRLASGEFFRSRGLAGRTPDLPDQRMMKLAI